MVIRACCEAIVCTLGNDPLLHQRLNIGNKTADMHETGMKQRCAAIRSGNA
jgi:hypothetical protein